MISVRRIQCHLQTMIRSAMVFFVFDAHKHTWLKCYKLPRVPPSSAFAIASQSLAILKNSSLSSDEYALPADARALTASKRKRCTRCSGFSEESSRTSPKSKLLHH